MALLTKIGSSAGTTVSPAELLQDQHQGYWAEDSGANESMTEDSTGLEH